MKTFLRLEPLAPTRCLKPGEKSSLSERVPAAVHSVNSLWHKVREPDAIIHVVLHLFNYSNTTLLTVVLHAGTGLQVRHWVQLAVGVTLFAGSAWSDGAFGAAVLFPLSSWRYRDVQDVQLCRAGRLSVTSSPLPAHHGRRAPAMCCRR